MANADKLPVYHERREQGFARWLLDQAERPDTVGTLAKAAKADRGFPRDGGYGEVWERLNALQADADMHYALQDAEIDYAAY